ncbi:MAG TPA: cell division protein ZipA C-terminal FtsZ-binding domain-containing protein [Woeseiaceae bacterium]|nr:cell division protein ZipA C-terminal FtsZ-binding domain-containing protein [Woeseiaceae bacterium]
MEGLRWILLLFGLLVVAGVYAYSRRGPARKETAQGRSRREPTLDAAGGGNVAEELLDSDVEDDPDFEPYPGDFDVDTDEDDAESRDVVRATVPQKIVTLRMIARNGGTFQGDEMILNLRGIGMRHGKFGIFHHFDGDNTESAVFSAASLVEPGSFDLANIKDQQIPGISMFAVMPGPVDGVEAFDMLMAAARTLAQSLDGELLDETGSNLSIQRERYMREEVVQYQHTHKLV